MKLSRSFIDERAHGMDLLDDKTSPSNVSDEKPNDNHTSKCKNWL